LTFAEDGASKEQATEEMVVRSIQRRRAVAGTQNEEANGVKMPVFR
jgi:hypothetical protein